MHQAPQTSQVSSPEPVEVEMCTCAGGIAAFRMPVMERIYVCEPFLRYLPG